MSSRAGAFFAIHSPVMVWRLALPGVRFSSQCDQAAISESVRWGGHVLLDPCEHLAVTFVGFDCFEKCIAVGSEKFEQPLVHRVREKIFAEFAGDFGAGFVDRTWQHDVAAETDAWAARWVLSEIGCGKGDHWWEEKGCEEAALLLFARVVDGFRTRTEIEKAFLGEDGQDPVDHLRTLRAGERRILDRDLFGDGCPGLVVVFYSVEDIVGFIRDGIHYGSQSHRKGTKQIHG